MILPLPTQVPPHSISVLQIIQQEVKKEPKLYTIKQGDNLTKIAKSQNTTVERLFEANPDIVNPDLLEPSQELKIPQADEVLKNREMPVNIENVTFQSQSPGTVVSKPPSGGFSNTYEPGQCVWFVKNKRPEIPNSWGNASDWLYNAQAQGWPTGTEPRVGAVGWTSGHVVLITGVHDGMVDYTDMNGRWVPFEIGYGTKPGSYYKYIY